VARFSSIEDLDSSQWKTNGSILLNIEVIMWEIANRTPFAADYSWVRDRNGADTWVVSVRGTFLIQPDGSTKVAEEQSEVCVAPKYLGAPGESSLVYESDLIHTKPTTDITLLGNAYAPPGKPAKRVDVTLKIASISKTLRVFGDRYWKKGVLGVAMTEPEPFEKMPLVYERAFGGRDVVSPDPTNQSFEWRNPVGCGFALKAEHLADQRAPNVEDPKNLISSWRQRPSPAGFGPIGAHWSPRCKWGGTYDEKWEKERQPLVPDDFDERFYLAAPADQQPPTHLRGGEPVELSNLTPQGHLHFQLPRVVLGFATRFYTGEVVRHRPVLHSVIIEPDIPQVIMVWNTFLECHTTGLKLDKTSVIEKRRIQHLVS
jgi:hypothetical protein